MHVEFVGPGRLGRTLAPMLSEAGHTVALRGRGEPVDVDADLVWLTVPDTAIAEAAAVVPMGPPVAHASGATGLDALHPHTRRGSLHPLMTFPGPEVATPDLRGVPCAIDATDEALLATLSTVARDLGMQPVRVPGDRRLYHAAAVMAGNLATVLLAEAGRILQAAGVDGPTARQMLIPLMLASARNAVVDPSGALTGPVARGDLATLDRHRAALDAAGLHDLQALYDEGVRRAMRLRDDGA